MVGKNRYKEKEKRIQEKRKSRNYIFKRFRRLLVGQKLVSSKETMKFSLPSKSQVTC